MSEPTVAGFVLAGGRSSRMGTDKASLTLESGTMLVRTATEVARATGSVQIIGRSVEGFRCVPDLIPNAGPIAGVAAALAATSSPAALIVACDMPELDSDWLRSLIRETRPGVTLPRTPDGRLHPLCAVWSRDVAPIVAAAARNGTRRMHDLLATLDCHAVDLPDAERHLVNLNTPADVQRWRASHGR
ncbi:MAG TPA: molybdenum cofactor guanylyltransferase [Bryobacteraceae bacterium]|nr:molybdenum cofactor guanylyltransferase [Bryobacteraceae bacterium]